MCAICDRLKETKIGYKTAVRIAENTEFILDRYKEGDKVFIHTSAYQKIDDEPWWWNTAYDVMYCPFCGSKMSENQHIDSNFSMSYLNV